MRARKARTVVFVLILTLGSTTVGTGSATAPPCKPGVKSRKAHPCATPKPAATTPTPQPVGVLNPQDPGNTGGRVDNGDAVTVVTVIDQSRGLYQLLIQNTSSIGYINTFNWVPPAGFTVTAVTSTEGGHCALSNGNISCTGGGRGVAPPACTCEAGAQMTVNFTASGDNPTFANGSWTYYGIVGAYLQITSMTPVPYHIPSFLSNPAQDLPLCKAGHISSPASPCATQ